MRNWDTRDESGTDKGCEWEKDWEDVQLVCKKLDIPCQLVSELSLPNDVFLTQERRLTYLVNTGTEFLSLPLGNGKWASLQIQMSGVTSASKNCNDRTQLTRCDTGRSSLAHFSNA